MHEDSSFLNIWNRLDWQCKKKATQTLRMEAASSSKTSVTIYQLKRRHIQKDFNFHNNYCAHVHGALHGILGDDLCNISKILAFVTSIVLDTFI
jgi:hypothetical protein